MFCELMLLNGRFRGLPEEVTGLAVAEGLIRGLGRDSEVKRLRNERTRVIDLGGRLVTPGLWDAHIHLYHWSQARGHLALGDCGSVEEVLRKVSQAPDQAEWVVGLGLPPDVFPRRRELDEASGGRPVLLYTADLHSAVAGTAALRRAGLMVENATVPGGLVEVDQNGMPTGLLRELAANRVREKIPPPSPSELVNLLGRAVKELNSLGVTAVCDQRIKDLDDGHLVMAALRRLEGEGRLSLRVSCNVAAHHLEEAARLGLYTGFGGERVRVGHLKVFSDGTLGSRTARMLQSLAGESQRGVYLTPPQEMEQLFRRAADTGFSISVHSIGDASNRICLDLFQSLGSLPGIPHRVEHAQIVDDADVERFAALALTVSAQPGHLLDDRDMAHRLLRERHRLCYRLKDFRDSGALLALGSDAPVSSPDPRYGLLAAIRRAQGTDSPWQEEQCLSLAEALEGYTVGAARAAGWENLGVLREGAPADLVVWENGWKEVSRERVHLTVSGGKVVYEGGAGKTEFIS